MTIHQPIATNQLISYGQRCSLTTSQISKFKSSLHSRYYAEAHNEWWDPSPRLSAWATQKRHSGCEPLAAQCPHVQVSDSKGPRTFCVIIKLLMSQLLVLIKNMTSKNSLRCGKPLGPSESPNLDSGQGKCVRLSAPGNRTLDLPLR